MLSNHSSPAVVSASAAGKLPRAALIALLAAFVLEPKQAKNLKRFVESVANEERPIEKLLLPFGSRQLETIE